MTTIGILAIGFGVYLWVKYPVWNAGRGVHDRISATASFLSGLVMVLS